MSMEPIDSPLPRLFRLRQNYPASPALDVAETVSAGFRDLGARWPRSGRVAVAVGSRGITRLSEFVTAVVDAIRSAGLTPFLVPAMGSHGGGTPAGQAAILATYGITPEALGVELDASLDTTVLGRTPEGVEVHASTAALRAQGVVVINRIKPHTDFSGPVGSGLLKMLAVGLGKRNGAVAFHRAASRLEPGGVIRTIARTVLERLPVLAGVAIVEDRRHQPALAEVVPATAFEAAEARLLTEAAARMPRLPFDDIDLLIVDRLGKNISGTGMDPNVINRAVEGYSSSLAHASSRPPRIRRILVRDLTPETHGNAIGLGLADFTTSRVVEGMDRQATFLNALTALNVLGAKTPIHFESDRTCLRHALASLTLANPRTARVVRIRDTLSLETLEASESMREEAQARTDLTVLSEPAEAGFDEEGNLE